MRTVLIVDDEAVVIRTLKKRVAWSGYGIENILTAASMQEAQEIFKNMEVDLMLCDIEMPDGNGLELFEWVKLYFPYVVCIYVTCHPDFQYIQKAMRLGTFDYVLKPIDYQELGTVLQRALAQLDGYENVKKHVHERARTMLSEQKQPTETGKEVIRAIKKYVREHLNEEIVMVDLADVVHMNAQYMVRMFKKQEGISILEYITRERIQTAKNLLCETDYSINRVADLVGYPNYSYFTKVFKKMEGLTPQEYRKAKTK